MIRKRGVAQFNHGGACANHQKSSRGWVCLRGWQKLTAASLP
jgi:hypothetical protein